VANASPPIGPNSSRSHNPAPAAGLDIPVDLDVDDTGSWLDDAVSEDDTAGWARSVIGSDSDPTPTPQKSETTVFEKKIENKAENKAENKVEKKPAGNFVSQPRATVQTRREKAPKRPLWRGRIIPKTVLGIAFTMMVAGLAMAASGTLLFMRYQFQQSESDALVRNFPAQVRLAQRAVQNEGRNARAKIQQDLDPLRKLAATSETLNTVLTSAEPSVWGVRTLDVDGQGVPGTAFVVASDDEKTFLLTSHAVIRASTTKPGPEIKLRKGSKEFLATLWTWDEGRDLALLVVSEGRLPPLSWAAPTTSKLGDQVFVTSGFGSANAAIIEGRIADVSGDGLQHTAPIGTAFRGGPVLDGQGRVVAVATRSYAPLGFISEGVFFAPPVQSACEKVLRCLNNRVEGAGAQR
jgi:S1-C subfamily serine protease